MSYDSEEWRDSAACAEVDPDLWFPPIGGSGMEAKKICASCDALLACRQYALDAGERVGVWGGMTEHEMRKLRRES